MSWFAVVVPTLVGLGMLWGPGLVATAFLRLGWVARAALAGVGGVAALGLAGIVFGTAGFAFQAWQPFAIAVPFGALGLLQRRRMLLPTEPRLWPLAVGWAIGIGIIAVVAFWRVPDPTWFSQTYDNVFHLSAVASIVDGGSASSLTLRTLIETGRATGFYPAAWHTLVTAVVQLTGAGVGLAANAAWLAVCAAVWLPGVAWLAQTVLHRAGPVAVGTTALVAGALFPWMPYSLLGWGTLYPTFLATAVLPVAVAIPVVTWTRLKGAHRPALVVVAGGVALAAALFAMAVAQPRVIPGWLVLVAPGAVAVGVHSAVGRWRAGGRPRRRMLWTVGGLAAAGLLVAGAAFLYAVVALGLFTRPLDDRLGGPQAAATQSVLDGLVQVIGVAGVTGASGVVTWPSPLLATVVVVGAVAAWRRGSGWLVVSYVLVAILFAAAAGSDSAVAKLATGVWYKDRYRLASLLPVVGTVLAVWGVTTIAAWLAGRIRRVVTVRAALVVIVVADGSALPAASRWLGEVPEATEVEVVADVGDDLAWVERYLAAASGREVSLTAGGGDLAATVAMLGVDDDTFVFAAGEASRLVRLRRYLRRELGLPAVQVAMSGYWKRGQAGFDHHAPIDPDDPDD